MTTPNRTIDPIVKILLERNAPLKDQIESTASIDIIETLRSVQLANLICTNAILDLVVNRAVNGSGLSETP